VNNVHTFYFLFFVEALHFFTGVYDLSRKNVMHLYDCHDQLLNASCTS
jgi:hypothetical protein